MTGSGRAKLAKGGGKSYLRGSAVVIRTLLMRDLDKIRDIVRELVEGEIAPVEVLDVSVEESLDGDGDEYLRIRLLYDGVPKDLDYSRVVSIVRLLRPRLLELAGETAFPVISYISKDDLGERQFAAA